VSGAPRRLTRRLCLLALVAAAQTACAPEVRPDPDVVHPRFGWTAGMTARVVTESEEFDRRPVAGDTLRERSVATLLVLDHPEGLEIVWDDSARADAAELPSGAEALGGIVVSKRGTFIDLQGDFEASQAMRRLMQETVGNPELLAVMEAAFTDEAFRSAAIEEWSLLVGRWAGREIAFGEIHQERSTVPFSPGGPVRTIVEWAAEGRVPCDDGESDARCVRFRVRTAYDVDDLGRSFRVQRAAAGGPEPWLDQVTMILVVVETRYVVAEEATLRPRHIDAEMSRSFQFGDRETSSVERRRTRFIYPR
jgi:hypothetical protein